MAYENAASAMLAPKADQYYLADTGTAESSNDEYLLSGRYATIKVGAEPIRVRFSGELSTASAVATTDLILNAYERFDWVVEPHLTDVVYIEAADGLADYEAWVWTSSPKV